MIDVLTAIAMENALDFDAPGTSVLEKAVVCFIL